MGRCVVVRTPRAENTNTNVVNCGDCLVTYCTCHYNCTGWYSSHHNRFVHCIIPTAPTAPFSRLRGVCTQTMISPACAATSTRMQHTHSMAVLEIPGHACPSYAVLATATRFTATLVTSRRTSALLFLLQRYIVQHLRCRTGGTNQLSCSTVNTHGREPGGGPRKYPAICVSPPHVYTSIGHLDVLDVDMDMDMDSSTDQQC